MTSGDALTVLTGRVAHGFGLATANLSPVTALICARVGFRRLQPGTLNVRLDAPFAVDADAEISAAEYHGWERLKLRRCCVGGLRAVIVRPETHEAGNGHGPACVELVAEVHLREALGLADDDLVEIVVGEPLACWAAGARK